MKYINNADSYNTELRITIDVVDERSIVSTRKKGREIAAHLGFNLADQTKLATAISELTRNVIQYAEGQGKCTIKDESNQDQLKVTVTVKDAGPGIADTELAMQVGFSTGRGLGVGLPCTKRLMQEFKLESKPGGTEVTVSMCRPRLASSAGAFRNRQRTSLDIGKDN